MLICQSGMLCGAVMVRVILFLKLYIAIVIFTKSVSFLDLRFIALFVMNSKELQLSFVIVFALSASKLSKRLVCDL